jgi:diguanylate cyclase (GGDEF)-like protein/PAS domain S-box-containing protein
MNSQHAARRQRRRYGLEWLLFCAVAALVFGLAGMALLQTHRDIGRTESNRLATQAKVIHDNLLQQFDGADQGLLGVRRDFFPAKGVPPAGGTTERRLSALTDALPGVRAMFVLDVNGVVVATSQPDGRGHSMVGREFFTTPRDSFEGDLLYMSRPYKSAEGVWTVNLSRRLLDASGQFAGIVSAVVEPRHFEVVQSSVLYAPDMRTTLVHGSGMVFGNMPVNAATLGMNIDRPGSMFARHRESGASATQFSGRIAATGEDRMIANRTIGAGSSRIEPPMVIHVSRLNEFIFAAWRQQAAVMMGTLAVVALGAAAALWLLQRRRREVEAVVAQARREREEHERRLRDVVDNIPALVGYIDSEGRYTFGNAKHEAWLGVDPAGMDGRRVEEVTGRKAYEAMRPAIERALAGERSSWEGPAPRVGRYFHIDYIPDRGPDGAVRGCYAMVTDISDRKGEELRREAVEKRLRDITDSIPAAIAYCDLQQRCHFFNSGAIRALGLDRNRLDRYTLREALGEESHSLHAPHLPAVMAGKRVSFEANWLHHDRSRFFLANLVPEWSADGEVTGFYVMSFDITPLKRAELQHVESERRLRAITDSVPVMISHFDRDERCDFANRHCGEIYQCDPSELLGKTIQDVRGEAVYEQTRPHIDAVLRGERANFEVYATIRGRAHWFQQNYVPDFAPEGWVRGFYSVSVDITDRKRDEETLAANERLLRAVTDNLPVMISYIDSAQRLRFINETINTWMGVDIEAAIGRPLREVLGDREFEPRREHLERALAGERVEFELESDAKGVHRNMQTIYVPDVRPDGSVAGVYGMSTDVSALKRVERQLQALARFDALTGLPNRHQFNERLDDALARAARTGDCLAVMFLDVDHFKSINDSLGHAMGDAVLREFGRRLQDAVRSTDCVARLAGDEFVIILEGLRGEAEPQFVARKILAQIGHVFDIDGRHLSVSTSVGIAVHRQGVISGSDLLARADKALYEAKAAGRNTYRVTESVGA